MAKVFSAQEFARRFAEEGSAKSGNYGAGTKGKGSVWVAKADTDEAEKNFNLGVTEAVTKKTYRKGVRRAGAQAYDTGTQDKGVLNWPTGILTAQKKMADRITPFVNEWVKPLPTPKGRSRSAANTKRIEENRKRFEAVADAQN